MSETLLPIFAVCIVGGIFMMFSGIIMRSLIPGCSQNYSKDFSAAMAMLSSFGIILIIALLNGSIKSVFDDAYPSSFGETMKDVFPFFECISTGKDAITLLKGDLAYFIEELIHLVFMTEGLQLLNELLPTTGRGDSKLGDIFIRMAAQFILLGILAMIYQHIKDNGTIYRITSVIVSVLTLSMPLPAIISWLSVKKNAVYFGAGFVIGLFCAHCKTVINVIVYMAVISFISMHLPEVANGINVAITFIMAAGPALIMILGICIMVKGALFTR